MTDTTPRQPFLLEIGSEEIPARFIPTAMTELSERLRLLLEESHLDHEELRIVATPRRLTAQVSGLAVRQPDREEEIKGPPVQVAFDAAGEPTKAGLGFARKLGVDLGECGRGTDQRGEHLLVRRTLPGRPAAEVLGERLGELILSLPFRKTMRWGDLDIEYARPLQWLVCLLGAEVIPVTVGNIASGRVTRGHRTLTGDRRTEVDHCDRYDAIMAELCVMPDPAARRQRILDQTAARLETLAEPGVLRQDEELLGEVVNLCEHPTVFVGGFEPEFFELPAEVIVTALKSHQRYFVVDRADGAGLLPCFVAVRDGGEEHLAGVQAGNERVLRARLADALFYWRFDQQKTPDEHAAALAQVTWLEGFGSVADQTGRAAVLARTLWAGGLGDGDEPPALSRAAAISRFDLVTEMIKDGKEFTKLEGVIAARYAAAAGESPEVCTILEQSQLPRSAAGELAADRASSVLSAAWRLDTLAGCWLAGFAPTGAKDPYALRRHALAILRILLHYDARVDLSEMLAKALSLYADLPVAGDRDLAAVELYEFTQRRLEGWLVDNEGLDQAVVRAVLPVRGSDPADARAWIQALEEFRTREDFLLLATGFKRCTNILKGEVLAADQRDAASQRWLAGGRGAGGEDFTTLSEPAEVALRDAVAAAIADILQAESRREYRTVFQLLSGLGPTIDRFFEEVRVNAEDPVLLALRHAFLREIHALFLRFADFSRVAPEE